MRQNVKVFSYISTFHLCRSVSGSCDLHKILSPPIVIVIGNAALFMTSHLSIYVLVY